MKFSYILQIKELSIMMICGLFLGIIYEVLNIIPNLKKNIVLQITADIIFSFISLFSFIIIINVLNRGEIRLFLLIGFLLGFVIERITIGKLFAKTYKKMYTFIVKALKSLYRSNLGRIIFK